MSLTRSNAVYRRSSTALVAASLACTGLGRRLQVSTESWHNIPSAHDHGLLQVRGGTLDALGAFAKFVLAECPTAASFHHTTVWTSSRLAHSPVTLRTRFGKTSPLGSLGNESASTGEQGRAASAPKNNTASGQRSASQARVSPRDSVAKPQGRDRLLKVGTRQQVATLLRITLPTVIAAVVGFFYYDKVALAIRSVLDADALKILEFDESQFMQNFLSVNGLLFSILAGNAYAALYAQQEAIYLALYQEVSEAKSLLEQTTLVCQGRPFYKNALICIREYVKNDLRRLDVPPAKLLSTRPMEDPLESIMYMTSVGVPSIVYETVRNLRQARGNRLGAMQRKFPSLGIGLLYVLAFVELIAFPLLGAGIAYSKGILLLHSFLFGCMSGSVMLVLRIIQELWSRSGGVFNVDGVLQQMVLGLEEELELRDQRAPMLSPTAPNVGMVPMPAYLNGVSGWDLRAAQTFQQQSASPPAAAKAGLGGQPGVAPQSTPQKALANPDCAGKSKEQVRLLGRFARMLGRMSRMMGQLMRKQSP